MSLMLPSTSAGLQTMLVCSTTDTWMHRTVSPSQQCVLIGHCCTQYPALVETLKHQCHLVFLHQSNPCTMIRITPRKVAGEGGRKEQSAPLHSNLDLVSRIDNLTHLSP